MLEQILGSLCKEDKNLTQTTILWVPLVKGACVLASARDKSSGKPNSNHGWKDMNLSDVPKLVFLTKNGADLTVFQ